MPQRVPPDPGSAPASKGGVYTRERRSWKYAQDICLRLADHSDAAIRANACLGLAYVARTQGRLEKHLVKPVLLRELRSNLEFCGRVQDAIDDINSFLKWKLGKASEAT